VVNAQARKKRSRGEREREGTQHKRGTWEKDHDSRRLHSAPARAPLFPPPLTALPPLRRSRDVGTPRARRPPPRLPFHTALPPVTPSPLRSSCSFVVVDRCVLLAPFSRRCNRRWFLGVLGFNFQVPITSKEGSCGLASYSSLAPVF
jgi:hypothetical protein